MSHPVTIRVDIPNPEPVFVVSGGTIAKHGRLLVGDKITFTHTGSAGCSEANCTTTVGFTSSSGLVLPSLSYGSERGIKSIDATDEDYIIQASDYGKSICRQVNWSYVHPDGKTGEVSGSGKEACVSIPTPTLAIVPSSTNDKVSSGAIYAGQTVTFTHHASATCVGGCSNILSFSSVDGSNSGIINGINTTNRNVSFSYGDGTGSTTKSMTAIVESYRTKDADIGKTICRQLSWSNGSGAVPIATGKNPSDQSCVTVEAPPCAYTTSSSITGPGTIVVNNFANTNLAGSKFAHTFRFNITSTESGHRCVINPGTFQAWTNPASKQSLLDLATALSGFNTNTNLSGPEFTRSFNNPLGWSGFERSTKKGHTYCEYDQSTSTNSLTGTSITQPNPPASACATADRLNYNLTITASPTVNGAAKNVAQPNNIIKFRHNIQADKALTDKFNVRLEQTIVAIGTDPNSGSILTISTVNNNDVYPRYSGTDVTGAGARRDDLWWNNDGEPGTFKADNTHLGQKICQRLVTVESANLGNTGGNATGSWICVEVPYQYELTPTVTVNDSSGNISTTPGAEHPIAGSVNNNGPTKSKDTNWVLSEFKLNPGQTPSTPGVPNRKYDQENINGTHPKDFFNPNNSYKLRDSGQTVFSLGDVANFITNKLSIPADAKVGEKYCITLSVQPYKASYPVTASDNNWRHARPVCAVVSKHPTAQIHGAGLSLPNGSTKGAITTSYGLKYGSWIEYDILSAKEADSSVASNAGHLIGGGTAAQSQWHKLTFANTPAYGNFGTGLPSNRANTIFNYYANAAKGSEINAASPSINLSTHSYAAAGNITYVYHTGGGSLNLTGGSIPPGRSLVIVKEGGDVVIKNNLTYGKQDSFTQPSDYSQLLIVVKGGNIIVEDSVTQIDAWLVATGDNDVAKGRLKTCQHPKVSMYTCTQPLTVNGPVITDYVDLMRTHGGDVSNGSLSIPAEIFNFRPDAYLWAMGRDNTKTNYEVTYTIELPPRY